MWYSDLDQRPRYELVSKRSASSIWVNATLEKGHHILRTRQAVAIKAAKLRYGVGSGHPTKQNERDSWRDPTPNKPFWWRTNRLKLEHDHALESVLKRLDDNGVSCNWKKCLFDIPELQFVELKLTNEGMKPNPAKAVALHHAGSSTSKEELQFFLGMTTVLPKAVLTLVCAIYLRHLR